VAGVALLLVLVPACSTPLSPRPVPVEVWSDADSLPPPLTGYEIVDLSLSLHEGVPAWPGPGYTKMRVTEIPGHGGKGAGSRVLTLPELHGTHVDAPRHFGKTAMSIADIPVRRLFRPAVVVDVRASVLSNPDHRLSLNELLRWEGRHGRMDAGAIVLLRTGFRFPEGGTVPDAVWRHFPGYSLEAARFLIEERGVVCLGTDAPSVDPGSSDTYDVHIFGSKRGVYFLHNVTHLEVLPPRGFAVWVAPLRLEQGSGSPARVFAFLKPGR